MRAYTKIFRVNPRAQFLRTTYVDAFAGTGYIQVGIPELPLAQVMPELADLRSEIQAQADEYKKGSVVRALELEPPFHRYLFIERDVGRYVELCRLTERFPDRKGRIEVVNADANEYLLKWCHARDWRRNRAVVFLDPFGMQVDWALIESIAATKAIDLWLLFPLFAANRLLVTKGKPPENWATRLTRILGTDRWEDEFYRTEKSLLIQGEERTIKVADIKKIGEFFVDRLRSVFTAVAEPLTLTNTRGTPLFLFCFAAGNPRGAPTAVGIAKDIIGG